MSFKRITLALALAAGAATHAGAVEIALPTILAGYGSGATLTSFAALSSADWNQAGTKLTFTLLSENTRWDVSQTSSTTTQLFAGTAVAGSVFSYTLAGPLTGITFNSNSGTASQQASAENTLTSKGGDYAVYSYGANKYAFAYEDWDRNVAGGDYNDMVLGLSVTPVPEPETYALMGLGLAALALTRRRAARRAG